MDESHIFVKPVILTMIPIKNMRDINGYFSQLMYLMQIRSLSADSNYTISDLPFDIVSGEPQKNLTDTIIQNIPIGDVSTTKQFMRNINIFSYCAGNEDTASMLHKIHDYLEQNNYSQEEIKDIMQEVFVLQVVDNYRENGTIVPIPFATTVIVQDIYDSVNENHVLDFNSDNPFVSTMQDNGVRYMLYNSFGEGSLFEEAIERDHVFKDDYALAPVINTVMSIYFIKAISASTNNTSKKEISIYSDLQVIIRKAQDFIKSKNKTPEELTIDEKKELNAILFEDIQKIFQSNIKTNELNHDRKRYLMEKDAAIELLRVKHFTDIFIEYNSCMNRINTIIDTYNHYSFGEIIGHKYDNSGMKIDVTREDEINKHLSSLDYEIASFKCEIDNLTLPEGISPSMKDEFLEKIKIISDHFRNKIYSEELQKIISETLNKDKPLKNMNF